MRRYTGMRPHGDAAVFTPAPPVFVLDLEGQAGRVALVTDLWWGGESATTAAMRTRFSRDSAAGTGARTAVTVAKPNGPDGDPYFYLSSAYATTDPAPADGVLFGCAWNAHGGIVRWKAGPNDGFYIVGATSAQLRQVTGSASMAAGIGWEEQ